MTDLRRPAPLEPRPRDGIAVAALAAIVVLPFVVAVVRAIGDGWRAVGDNGNFLIRSRDVLTSHHPLLGTWSSASLPLGEDVNHPGPLLFDVFALPAKLGGSGGMAVGVVLLHAVCVALLALFAWRAGGLRLSAASLAATAALSWTMGSELLYDPWNPHVLLFPFLLVLVLTVAMAMGDTAALPVAVGAASLVVQTHLSYTLLVPPLVLLGVGWLVWRHRWHAVRAVVIAAVVGVLCWAQPVADQVIGEGNLGALAGGLGVEQETVGAGLGARVVAEVLATPPWWLRPSFAESFTVPPGQPPLLGERPNIGGLPSTGAALVGLAAAAGVLVGAWFVARRRRDRVARRALVVTTFGLVVALLATVRLPVGGVGVPPHQVRYLWPLSAFAAGMAVVALLPARWATRAVGAVAVVLAVLTLPTYEVPAGPQRDADAIPVVRELARQLDTIDDEGPLLYDTSGLRFAEPWTSALMALLQERGIDFTVDDPVWARQLGAARADDGAARGRLFVLEGEAAREVPAGTRRVAFVDGLDDDERRELRTLERELVDVPIELNDDGRAALGVGSLPSFEAGTPRADQLLQLGELAALLNSELLVVPDERARDLRRYAALRYRSDRHTVGLFLDPTPYDDAEDD